MVSFGFHILLRSEEAATKYKQYHQDVWPQVHKVLEKIGLTKMRIFFVDPLRLFMYIEAKDGFNPEKDFDQAEEMDPKVNEWCDIMNNHLLERLNPNEGSLVWKLMEDIYHFEALR